jgi:transcriptional regulator with GAF, ATPase, and Fis domain
VLEDNGAWVRDLGSTNGTYVEDVLVTGARIPEGGRVVLGQCELLVTYGDAPVEVPLWPDDRFGPLIGSSPAMRELFARLARIAATDATVLIQGETGVGKELVARAIHEASPRSEQPYVIVDCAALPENLLEAELFGHAKGAFTGAMSAREGALEAANRGTVFLDEIGELPLPMQPKLLRAIESRTIRRIGETAQRPIDVRFVSATHRDLQSMVNAREFREDLYFRLAVVPVLVPPLRARPEDIPALVEHFTPARSKGAVAPDLMRDLATRRWAGNVRELRNFVERAMALGAREALAMAPQGAMTDGATTVSSARVALPPSILDLAFKEAREQWLEVLEREYIRGLLAKHNRSIAAVSRAAGLDRSYIHKLIRRHGV